MVSSYVPDRGDIVWVNFNPQKGHEQAGRRPAIVLSFKSYNQRSGLMIACPITSKVKQYPFEVHIKEGAIDGAILADQVRNLDWTARPVVFEHKATTTITLQTLTLIQLLLQAPR